MTQEEKAKAYDEALEKARQLCLYPTTKPFINDLQDLFPELKESEDERIRKELIEFTKTRGGFKQEWITWLEKQGETSTILSNSSNIGNVTLSEEEQNRFAKCVLTSCASSFIDYLDAHKYEGKMCVSNGECEDIENAFHNAMWDRLHRYYCKYIEKQGEQKPADKVEPKFHKGDWVVTSYGKVNQVITVDEDCDGFTLDDDTYFSGSWKDGYHLWTIQDANDGDVLVASDDSIFIYAGSTDRHAQFYIALSKYGDFNTKGGNWEDKNCIKPATKEQRDTLIKAMTDAGYTFDFEKKELKKISQRMVSAEAKEALYDKPAWSEEDENTIKVLMNIIRKSEIIDSIIYTDSLKEKLYDWLKSIKDRVQPKQEWNKGDMEMLNAAISFVEKSSFTTIGKGKNNTVAWLKSLKSRVIPQSRQEWSEEDKKMFVNIKAYLRNADKDYSKELDWLKSLRPQKPTKWSEDDETGWTNTMIMIKEVASNHYTKDSIRLVIDWLNSLKQRMGGKV